MIRMLIIVVLFHFALSKKNVYAQTENRYDFGVLRQNDDMSGFRNIDDKSFYETLKYSPISDSSFISFGGSIRSQFEYFDNENFEANTSEGWLLNRLMFHTKFQISDDLYFFCELLGAYVNSKENPSPIDRDEVTVNQLFVEYSKNNYVLRVGRVNPTLGSNRIVSLREGRNTRRYFDGLQGGYKVERLTAQGFYYQPVSINPYGFDNDALDGDEYLYGFFATLSSQSKSHNLDINYIGRHINAFKYAVGTGSENRHSLGFRYFGNIKKLKFDLEGLYQFGKFESLDIAAWTLSLNANYGMSIGDEGSLNVGFKTEYISGDDNPDDDKLTTFNALYPRGAYFGRVAQFGPMNLFDLHPSLTYSFKKWMFFVDYVAFWRASNADAVYGAGLNLSFPDVNQEYFIGHQYGAAVGYKFNSFFSFEVEANYIKAGSFLKQSDLNNNLFHFVSTLQFTF